MMVSTKTVFELRDLRDDLERRAATAAREGRDDDHFVLAQAYHRIASIESVGYRAELVQS